MTCRNHRAHEKSLRCSHPPEWWFKYSDGCEGQVCDECWFDLELAMEPSLFQIDSYSNYQDRKMREAYLEAIKTGKIP